jgi:curli biogenesis system outer membrane secretion channel CsgG
MDSYALICANNQIRPTIAVISFEDNCQSGIPNLNEIGLIFLESKLIKTEKFSLIDRDAIQEVIKEIYVKDTQETKEAEYYYRLSRMLGACYFATGSIVSLNHKVVEFEGDDIHTRTLYIDMTVNLKVVDVIEGTVFFVGEKKIDKKIPWLGSRRDSVDEFQGIC